MTPDERIETTEMVAMIFKLLEREIDRRIDKLKSEMVNLDEAVYGRINNIDMRLVEAERQLQPKKPTTMADPNPRRMGSQLSDATREKLIQLERDIEFWTGEAARLSQEKNLLSARLTESERVMSTIAAIYERECVPGGNKAGARVAMYMEAMRYLCPDEETDCGEPPYLGA